MLVCIAVRSSFDATPEQEAARLGLEHRWQTRKRLRKIKSMRIEGGDFGAREGEKAFMCADVQTESDVVADGSSTSPTNWLAFPGAGNESASPRAECATATFFPLVDVACLVEGDARAEAENTLAGIHQMVGVDGTSSQIFVTRQDAASRTACNSKTNWQHG